MGWCSGTYVFDSVVGHLLSMNNISEFDKKLIIKNLIEELWNHDWDCEYYSGYIDEPIVRIAFKELDNSFFSD